MPEAIGLYEADRKWHVDSFTVNPYTYVWTPDIIGSSFGEINDYSAGDVLEWDVTSLINNVIEKDFPFNGFLLIAETFNSMACNFYSSESKVVEYRPKLVIEVDNSIPVVNTMFNSNNYQRGTILIGEKIIKINIPKITFSKVILNSINGKSINLNITADNFFEIKNISKGIYYLSFMDKRGKIQRAQTIIIN